jgi:hypothetical protein
VKRWEGQEDPRLRVVACSSFGYLFQAPDGSRWWAEPVTPDERSAVRSYQARLRQRGTEQLLTKINHLQGLEERYMGNEPQWYCPELAARARRDREQLEEELRRRQQE